MTLPDPDPLDRHSLRDRDDAGDGTAFDRTLGAAKRGEGWAARALFLDLHPRLHRYLVSEVRDAADDVTSEVWEDIARGLARFEGGELDFRAWAFTIASRRVIDHRRREGRHPSDPSDIESFGFLAAPDAPDRQAVDRLAVDEAIALIGSLLPPDQARVVLLRVLGDLGTREVAEIMGQSENWVRVTQHRALRKLADRLGPKLGVAP